MHDEARGIEAQRVLENPLYQEAFKTIESHIVSQLSQIELPKDRAEYLRSLLIANRKVRGYLEQAMVTGKFAEQERERQTRFEKAREAVSSLFSRY